MITVVVGKEIEKIKGDFESVINGLNMVGTIPYNIYSELFDVGTDCIQKAYELGKSELEKENVVIWHDLRENPDDLPPRKGLETYSGRVITDRGYGMYNFRKCGWYVDEPDCGFMVHTEVIAWCEIPRYTEE